jgi:hypothetical protein
VDRGSIHCCPLLRRLPSLKVDGSQPNPTSGFLPLQFVDGVTTSAIRFPELRSEAFHRTGGYEKIDGIREPSRRHSRRPDFVYSYAGSDGPVGPGLFSSDGQASALTPNGGSFLSSCRWSRSHSKAHRSRPKIRARVWHCQRVRHGTLPNPIGSHLARYSRGSIERAGAHKLSGTRGLRHTPSRCRGAYNSNKSW